MIFCEVSLSWKCITNFSVESKHGVKRCNWEKERYRCSWIPNERKPYSRASSVGSSDN